MGDMADMLIEQGFEMMLDGDVDPYNDDFPQGCLKTCKYCKETGLHWERFKGQWRLFTSYGNVHACWETKGPILKSDIQRHHNRDSIIATRCPHCGDEYGMSFGTGDCDCEPDREVGLLFIK